jgi:hypothetical protein
MHNRDIGANNNKHCDFWTPETAIMRVENAGKNDWGWCAMVGPAECNESGRVPRNVKLLEDGGRRTFVVALVVAYWRLLPVPAAGEMGLNLEEERKCGRTGL